MHNKRNIIEAAMKNNNLVFFFVAVIVLFGFLSLPRLKKNEFPDVTIRQGVVAVVYPGATAEEIEERVATLTEQYLFTFGDVDKKIRSANPYSDITSSPRYPDHPGSSCTSVTADKGSRSY